jgi:gas vesicle protein
MSQSADEIRAEIESTRRDLGQDVDALADKVNPSKIVDRQKNKLFGALSSVKDRVMGAADDAAESVKDAGHAAGSGIKDAGQTVAHKAQGNPLAAGLIAFGVGLLVSALIPPSDKERELAATVEEKAQPLVDSVKDAAREVGENLREPAREAVESVKGTAQDAAHHVADDAKASGETVAEETRRAASRAQSDMGSGVS